ncbi:MAG TPA: hypothetical protein PKW95_18965 [bacterium]|nr:hypothetical protein [bacterium]
MTKCYYHPKEDALYECSICGKSICGDCMRFLDDEQVVCPACTLENAIDLADDGNKEYLDRVHQLHEDEKKHESKFSKALKLINGYLLLSIVLLLAVNMYISNYLGRAGAPATFDPQMFKLLGDPVTEMSYILTKILRYANDHDGNFPEKLDDLFPDYLEKPPRVLGTEEQYSYAPIKGEEGFIFNLPHADRFGYRKLYVTADGIIKTE